MKIDGRTIADQILNDLSAWINTLQQQGITPALAVIQVGDDPGSTAYIRQKQKAADQIGAKLILNHESGSTNQEELHLLIIQFNNDPKVHGIIVQRPLPKTLHASNILPSKDIDGFLPGSPHPVPVAEAVTKILARVFHSSLITHHSSLDDMLRTKHIVVIGRGETAGKPIAEALIKQGCNVSVIHSQTPNPDEFIKAADVVISCVGKPNIVRRDNIKKGAILISVGLSRDSQGTLRGDYEEDEIKDTASYYTPTPGGVGPVNVACLMGNLVQAASKLL